MIIYIIMNSELDDWNRLFNIINDENENFNQANEFTLPEENDIDGYPTLISIEKILKNHSYYLNKWLIIVRHVINLDDYNFEVKKKKEKFLDSISKSNLSNKNKNKKEMKDINESKLQTELNEFKFRYMKNCLGIYENEKMDGLEFESYVKRTIYLILILLKKDNYIIYNPKKFPFNLFTHYCESLRKKPEEINNSKSQESQESFKHIINEKANSLSTIEDKCQSQTKKKKDIFEVDIVINKFKIEDLQKLISSFPQHFFWTEQLKLENIEQKEINIIGECSRDLIIQAEHKYEQAHNYIKIFNGLEILKSVFLDKDNLNPNNSNKEEINKLINSFDLQDISLNNIFMIISNGSYLLFKFTFSLIDKLLKKDMNKIDLELLGKEINDNKEDLEDLLEGKIYIYPKLIQILYKFFKELRNNNIRHFIMYVGNKSENIVDLYLSKKKDKKPLFKTNENNDNKCSNNKKNLHKENKNDEEMSELENIIELRKSIKNILDTKKKFDRYFELFSKNLKEEALNNQTILKINTIKNTSFKIKLMIYCKKDINETIINDLNKKYEVKINKIKQDDYNFLQPIIADIIKKTKNGGETIYIMITSSKKAAFITNEYLGFFEENTLSNIEQYLAEKNKMNQLIPKMFWSKIEEKKNIIMNKKIKFPFPFEYNTIIETIKNQLSSDFELDEENFTAAFKLLTINEDKKNEDNQERIEKKDLINEIINNINKTGKKYNIAPSEELESIISVNIEQMKNIIKFRIFYDYFINELFAKSCLESIETKYYN